MTLPNSSNKFPIYLAKIEISPDGVRKFVKAKDVYMQSVWGTEYDRFFFKLRKAWLNKPNCNFNCPPEKEFFCCASFGCKSHCGFFEFDEIAFFSQEEQSKILSFWDDSGGFLGKEGCVLPRELRSYICLAFQCNHSKSKE